MKLTNKTFNILRFLCEILVPGLGALYFGLSKLWGLPYGHEIVGTCACVATFLGAIVGINRADYKKQIEEETKDE